MAAPACTLNFDFENLIGESTGYAVLTLAGFLPQAPRTVGGVLAGITYSTAPAANTATVTVYSNAVLLPQNTYYLVTIFTADGRPVVQNVPYYLNDGTFNFQSLVPVGIPIPNVIVPTNAAPANTFFAGPTSGSPQSATFRQIGNSDLTGISVWDNVTVYADRVGGADNSAKIQAAINLLPATGGTVDARALPTETSGGSVIIDAGVKSVTFLLGPVTYYISQWVLESNTRIIGVGTGSSGISGSVLNYTTLFATGASDAIILSASNQPVQDVLLQGFRLHTATGNTHKGINLTSVGAFGCWSSTFTDVAVGATGPEAPYSFLGNNIHLQAESSGGAGVNQFLSFTGVQSVRGAASAGTGTALTIFGDNGQIIFQNCTFDGPSLNDGGINIQIGDGVSGLDLMPNTIMFIGCTVQLATTGVQARGCWDVTFLGTHVENVGELFDMNSGATNNNVNFSILNSYIVLSGSNGGSGYIIKDASGVGNASIVFQGNMLGPGSLDAMFINTANITVLNNVGPGGNNNAPINSNIRGFLGVGSLQVNGSTVASPTATGKSGTGSGNFTTTGTSYSVVDATNLSYGPVTVPIGWKIVCQASGNIQSSTTLVQVFAALVDTGSAGVLAESVTINTANAPSTFSLSSVFTGDGGSHTFQLQYKAASGSNAVILNTSVAQSPKMTFLLTPSN